MKALTLVSRDSLLALAQTIEAAMRFEPHGYEVKIVTLKTSGDLKLNQPLYLAAGQQKEGRAFFTKELDEALISGKASAAVHSFKDLPADAVPGLSDPVFFSETSAADILVGLGSMNDELVIGTSSLRRTHQLGHLFPQARIVSLRGNIVSRLSKLAEGRDGINAIAIAQAGFERLERFAELAPNKYAHFVTNETLAQINENLTKFRAFKNLSYWKKSLATEYFPTAPGQGVLAIQFSGAFAIPSNIFPEHQDIHRRVMIERSIMSRLGYGCHAPLGVSCRRDGSAFDVTVCLARNVDTTVLKFDESFLIRRSLSTVSDQIINELSMPAKTLVWWGGENAVHHDTELEIHRVVAFTQEAFSDAQPEKSVDRYAALFVSSPAAHEWLATHKDFAALPVFCAGDETREFLAETFKHMRIEDTKTLRGFAAVLKEMQQKCKGNYLWLGSKSGLARAQKTTVGAAVECLAVYENYPATPASVPDCNLHALTSAAAAEAFVHFQKTKSTVPTIFCFGKSAREVCEKAGFSVYYTSGAGNFSAFLDEISGAIRQIKKANEFHETNTI